ncbi:MAG: glutaminyl-peptide cyclotransferase, partial [Planctomycetota bacterium]
MDLADRRSRVRLIVSAMGIVIVLISLGLAAEYNRRTNREGSTWAQRSASAPVYSYRVVGTYPHDRNAFSQGLDFDGETLFESTGQYGKSSVRRVNLETGQVEKWLRLDNRLFGEGLTLFDDKLAQITWKRGIGYVYDAKT